MTQDPVSEARQRRRVWRELKALWPQGPLALVLAATGTLNFLEGLKLPLATLQRFRTLNGLAESLSAVGGTAQAILGLLLLVAGIGLLWRLAAAWITAVFLVSIAIAIDLARQSFGPSLVLEAVVLAALLLTKSRFRQRTAIGSALLSLSGVLAILTYGAVGSYLLGAGFRPEIKDLSTGFYYTVVSLSTVGYGDIVPVTAGARWFAVSLLIVGLGVFASALASALGPKISGEINRIFRPKEKLMELTDHVILAGSGAIARNTRRELTARGVPFVQIMAGSPPADTVPTADLMYGDATDDAVLQQAGIARARLIIAAHEDDSENAFISLGAKELAPNIRVLAVASSRAAIRRLKLARADLVFSPVAVGSRILADLVEGAQIAPEFQDLLEGQPKRTEGRKD